MTEKKEEKPEKTYTRKQVIGILERQISDCAESITADNLTGYQAKRLILETKIIDF